MSSSKKVNSAAPRGRRRRRSLSHVLAELEALTDAQLLRVWGHVGEPLSGGTLPTPRYLTAAGLNHEAILHLHLACRAGVCAAVRDQWRRLMIALWVQDEPAALVRPRWFPALDVPGDVAL